MVPWYVVVSGFGEHAVMCEGNKWGPDGDPSMFLFPTFDLALDSIKRPSAEIGARTPMVERYPLDE